VTRGPTANKKLKFHLSTGQEGYRDVLANAVHYNSDLIDCSPNLISSRLELLLRYSIQRDHWSAVGTDGVRKLRS
jgi:hypothetical protein